MQFLGAKFRIQLGPTVRNVIAHEVKNISKWFLILLYAVAKQLYLDWQDALNFHS